MDDQIPKYSLKQHGTNSYFIEAQWFTIAELKDLVVKLTAHEKRVEDQMTRSMEIIK